MLVCRPRRRVGKGAGTGFRYGTGHRAPCPRVRDRSKSSKGAWARRTRGFHNINDSAIAFAHPTSVSRPPHPHTRNKPVTSIRQLARVVAWMMGALLSFCVMAIAIRKLWGPLSIMEILALRAALGLAIIGAVAAFRPDERRSITMQRLPLHVLRNG